MAKPKFTPDPPPSSDAPRGQLIEWMNRQYQRIEDFWPKDLEDRVAALEVGFPYKIGTWPIVDYSSVAFNASAPLGFQCVSTPKQEVFMSSSRVQNGSQWHISFGSKTYTACDSDGFWEIDIANRSTQRITSIILGGSNEANNIESGGSITIGGQPYIVLKVGGTGGPYICDENFNQVYQITGTFINGIFHTDGELHFLIWGSVSTEFWNWEKYPLVSTVADRITATPSWWTSDYRWNASCPPLHIGNDVFVLSVQSNSGSVANRFVKYDAVAGTFGDYADAGDSGQGVRNRGIFDGTNCWFMVNHGSGGPGDHYLYKVEVSTMTFTSIDIYALGGSTNNYANTLSQQTMAYDTAANQLIWRGSYYSPIYAWRDLCLYDIDAGTLEVCEVDWGDNYTIGPSGAGEAAVSITYDSVSGTIFAGPREDISNDMVALFYGT